MKTLDQCLKQIELDARIVYIIGEVSLKGGDTSLVKVGITKSYQSLARRLQNLQSGNPRELVILHTFDYTADGLAYGEEQRIKKLFSFYSLGLHNEWFNINPDYIAKELSCNISI